VAAGLLSAAAAAAERQAFLDMSHDPDIITKLAASIAPKIKGQDDIKMAIACLLFGGSRKVCGTLLRHALGGSTMQPKKYGAITRPKLTIVQPYW
jgi:hypothetical protein